MIVPLDQNTYILTDGLKAAEEKQKHRWVLGPCNLFHIVG